MSGLWPDVLPLFARVFLAWSLEVPSLWVTALFPSCHGCGLLSFLDSFVHISELLSVLIFQGMVWLFLPSFWFCRPLVSVSLWTVCLDRFFCKPFLRFVMCICRASMALSIYIYIYVYIYIYLYISVWVYSHLFLCLYFIWIWFLSARLLYLLLLVLNCSIAIHDLVLALSLRFCGPSVSCSFCLVFELCVSVHAFLSWLGSGVPHWEGSVLRV